MLVKSVAQKTLALFLTTLLILPGLPVAAQETRATITGINPDTIPTGTAAQLTITGLNFSPSTTVHVVVNGTFWSLFVQSVSPTSMTFTTPSYLGPGSYPVVARTTAGDSNAVSLTVTSSQPAPTASPGPPPPAPSPTPRPTVSSITPATITAGDTPLLTVSGTGFTSGAQAHLLVQGAFWSMTTEAATATSISFRPPTYLPPGRYDVGVRTQAGDSNAVQLTVTAREKPTPTSPPMPPQPTPAPRRTTYTALGDSLALGFFSLKGYVTHFHEFLASIRHEPVALRNLGQSGWTSEDLRDALRHNQQFRQAVSDAEVITWNIGGNDLRAARAQYQAGNCGGADNQNCLRRTAARLKANWSAIIAEIRALSSGRSQTIRTFDIYNPFVNEDRRRDSWPADGGQSDFEVFKTYVDDVNTYIAQVTTGHGLALAPVYRTFNGSAGTQDPADKGFISPIDNFHPNTDGHAVIGRLLQRITPAL